MPTWSEITNEANAMVANGDHSALDTIRTKYLKELADYTGRDTIIYASRWTTGDAPGNLTMILDEDMQAFMECIYGLKNKNLDLILHTGGGSAEATDSIVEYLRQKYEHIRIIIPQAAMSAGTMLACSADEIIMGKQSSLGPIDPQFFLQTPVGPLMVPADAIIAQFRMAQEELIKDPRRINSWLPILNQYPPALLVRCENQIAFGRELIKKWMTSYMFKGETTDLPKKISDHLSDHSNFNTHSKHINCSEAIRLGLKISMMEKDQTFQDKILSAFHATMIAFNFSLATKVTANHNGRLYLKQMNQQAPSQAPKK